MAKTPEKDTSTDVDTTDETTQTKQEAGEVYLFPDLDNGQPISVVATSQEAARKKAEKLVAGKESK